MSHEEFNANGDGGGGDDDGGDDDYHDFYDHVEVNDNVNSGHWAGVKWRIATTKMIPVLSSLGSTLLYLQVIFSSFFHFFSLFFTNILTSLSSASLYLQAIFFHFCSQCHCYCLFIVFTNMINDQFGPLSSSSSSSSSSSTS